MAKRKKRKAMHGGKATKRKIAAKRVKAGQRTAAKPAAARAKAKSRVTRVKSKRATPKRKIERAVPKPKKAPVERVIVDTVEEPVPGMIVVTEYEAVVRRGPASGQSDDEEGTEEEETPQG